MAPGEQGAKGQFRVAEGNRAKRRKTPAELRSDNSALIADNRTLIEQLERMQHVLKGFCILIDQNFAENFDSVEPAHESARALLNGVKCLLEDFGIVPLSGAAPKDRAAVNAELTEQVASAMKGRLAQRWANVLNSAPPPAPEKGGTADHPTQPGEGP